MLAQTFADFEFIIIDDGSTDRSREILESFAKRDPRVRVVSRPNKGLVATLNEGLALARAPFVARIDADDLCDPRRFELQTQGVQRRPAPRRRRLLRRRDRRGRQPARRLLDAAHARGDRGVAPARRLRDPPPVGDVPHGGRPRRSAAIANSCPAKTSTSGSASARSAGWRTCPSG